MMMLHLLNPPSSLVLHADILSSVLTDHKSDSEFRSTVGLFLQDYYIFLVFLIIS